MFVITRHRIEIFITRKAMSGKYVKGRKRNSRMNPFISEERYSRLQQDCVLTNRILQNSCHTIYKMLANKSCPLLTGKGRIWCGQNSNKDMSSISLNLLIKKTWKFKIPEGIPVLWVLVQVWNLLSTVYWLTMSWSGLDFFAHS